MVRSSVALAAVVVALMAPRLADADTVVSGGAEVAIGEQASSEPTPYAATGAFLRLAVVPTIPEYTTAPRGYIWNRGVGFDITLRRGELEREEYAAALVGLRYDIVFSQRRMGLARISGKGGFYFVGRAGVIRSPGFVDEPPRAIPLIEPAPTFDTDPNRLLASGAAGTYVRFGGRVRMITEIGGYVIGGRGHDRLGGLHVRVGFGLDL